MGSNEIILFQSEDKSIALPVNLEDETVWLTQAQMAELFDKSQSVISRHINNVFEEKELVRDGNMHYLHIAGSTKPTTVMNFLA